MITLREITDENREEVYALRLAPGQERYVSTVEDSIQEAIEEPDGRALYWAVYDDHTPVGFVMITDETSGAPGYIPQYLWKLLVDERHQRRGYGSAILDLVVEYFRIRPGVEVMWTSAQQGEGSPIPFYERYGFEQTGDLVFDGEVLLRLRLR
jgi:diamine N-acetyltransferase